MVEYAALHTETQVENMSGRQDRDRNRPPFALDLSSRNTLAAQMENALRQAIAAGRYQPGESLPTVREWAMMLGVSMRVPETVITRLVKEGLIVARPRHGCIVAPRGAAIFRGHVLLVMPPAAYYRNANIISGTVTRTLEESGYLVSHVRANADASGRHDFSRLRLALRQSVDLAVFIYQSAAAARCAKASGIPFITIGNGHLTGAAGHVHQSNDAAFQEMAEDFRASGIRSVEILGKINLGREWEPVKALAHAGIKTSVSHIPTEPKTPLDERRFENVQRGAMDFFARRFARRSPPKFADVLFFTDDFLLQGAVPVLLTHGIRIPNDVKIASMTTHGFGPIYPFPFARVEINSYENGSLLANAILAYFNKGIFPTDVAFVPHYLPLHQ